MSAPVTITGPGGYTFTLYDTPPQSGVIVSAPGAALDQGTWVPLVDLKHFVTSHEAVSALVAQDQHAAAVAVSRRTIRDMAIANAAHLRARDGWCRKCGWDSLDARCPTEHPATCDGVT